MSDKYETFVRWYLRFNGYFCVENFIIHRSLGRSILQAAEFDVLAVRFPHSHELKAPDVEINKDVWLSLEHDQRVEKDWLINPKVDFVIAEVKAGRASINSVWRQPDPKGEKVAHIEYLLRWVGSVDPNDTFGVATKLQQSQCCLHEGFVYRVLGFCLQPRRESSGVPQRTFEQIARWIVTARTPCWRDLGLGASSAHDQWDPMMKEIWEIGNPKLKLDIDERVRQVLSILNGSSI